MIKSLAKTALRPIWARVQPRIEAIADRRLTGMSARVTNLDALMSKRMDVAAESAEALTATVNAIIGRIDLADRLIEQQRQRLDTAGHSMFASDPGLTLVPESTPFMQFSNCQAADFYHPRFLQLCKLMAMRPRFHRKQWEWVYVLHQLIEAGVLKPGARGLGFGVGTEPLPAVYASMGVDVTATDAPLGIEGSDGWNSTLQHSSDVSQLLRPDIAPDDLVRARVSHRPCDMNNIDPALTGYDFNWSSCCFEHLGTIEKGLQFVINAVEKTLKVGGVAVHTTEFNASSNDATVVEGETVIFRLRDMEELVQRLRDRGHEVQPFVVGATAHALDFHVDVPPYAQDVHLKLLLAGYVATSVGIVVRRGK